MSEKKNKLTGQFDEDAATAAAVAPSDENLKTISTLARLQLSLEDEVAAIEESLKKKKGELQTVSEIEIPTKLKELGLSSFALDTGEKIAVEDVTKANIAADWPPEKRVAAFAWLRKNGADAIIKAEIALRFGKGKKEKELQKKVEVALTKIGVAFEVKDGVAWNTLTAFVKERKEAGKPIDAELLGVHEFSRTKITRSK